MVGCKSYVDTLGDGTHCALLARELLLPSSAKEEGHVGVFLGFAKRNCVPDAAETASPRVISKLGLSYSTSTP